jgi:hypothetical protein
VSKATLEQLLFPRGGDKYDLPLGLRSSVGTMADYLDLAIRCATREQLWELVEMLEERVVTIRERLVPGRKP